METQAPNRAGQRERGLDLVRALALLRVMIWHATGAPVVTLVAAMPLMFFVSGSLFARSAERHGAGRTVIDRLRRIGPPLWAFAVLAWGVMAFGAWRSGTDLVWSRFPLWLVPVGDPVGSAWEGGWLATPLWYLRTLLWVMVLAPLMARAVRRAPKLSALGGVAAVVALEWAERRAVWQPAFAPRVLWQAGDVALFGLFFVFGMWTRTAATTIRPRRWVAASASLAVGAALWWWVAPPPGGIVNDSHLVHLVVGGAVVALVVAGLGPLERIAAHPALRAPVHLLGQRSLTIYLWHTAAIVVALWILDRAGVDPSGSGAVAYALLIAIGTVSAVAAMGWLEDLSARRGPVLWPLPAGSGGRSPRYWTMPVPSRLAAGAVAGAMILLLAAVPVVSARDRSSTVAAFRPRVPSQAPPAPTVDAEATEELVWRDLPATLDPGALQGLVDGWAVEHGVTGLSVAISVPGGGSWVGVNGLDVDGVVRMPEADVDTMSVTKLFTANLVYRAVDAGLIGLDEPLPPIEALPDVVLPPDLTVRQLLSHRSGLSNYRDTAPYQGDPSVVQGPADAVALSMSDPTTVGPGLEARYSSTNYLILGYLLEQLTRVSFDDLLDLALLQPLELSRTAHLAPGPGEPRFSTGGIVSDVEDLARAGEALLVEHVGISDDAWEAMSAMDIEAGLGAGTMQFCPCRPDADGGVEEFAIGYAGGHTLLAHLPGYDLVVAVDLTDDFYGDAGQFDAVQALVASLAAMVARPGGCSDGVRSAGPGLVLGPHPDGPA